MLLVGDLRMLLRISSLVYGVMGLLGAPQVCRMGQCKVQPPKALNHSPWISFFQCIPKSLLLPCLLLFKHNFRIYFRKLYGVQLDTGGGCCQAHVVLPACSYNCLYCRFPKYLGLAPSAAIENGGKASTEFCWSQVQPEQSMLKHGVFDTGAVWKAAHGRCRGSKRTCTHLVIV